MKPENFSKKLNPFNPLWNGTIEPLELEPLRDLASPWEGTLVEAFENIDPPVIPPETPFFGLGYPVLGLPETSVFLDLTTEVLFSFPIAAQYHIDKVRREKFNHTRPMPSEKLIDDKSTVMDSGQRKRLLDAVARLVDEDLFGRCAMCVPFAKLLNRALNHLGYPAREVWGQGIYPLSNGREKFWSHAWVKLFNEVIDPNADSVSEHPLAPAELNLKPYWGPVDLLPKDRRLLEDHGEPLPSHVTADDLLWPALRTWLDERALQHQNQIKDGIK